MRHFPVGAYSGAQRRTPAVLALLARELVWQSAQMFGTEADFVQMLDHAIAQPPATQAISCNQKLGHDASDAHLGFAARLSADAGMGLMALPGHEPSGATAQAPGSGRNLMTARRRVPSPAHAGNWRGWRWIASASTKQQQ
jgi:hypothetical protein